MVKDSGDFGAEMAKTGVKPLEKRKGKVLLESPARDAGAPLRRRAASSELPANDLSGLDAGLEWLGPHDVVEYKKYGVQHEVFKNLKQGRYVAGADLDLHNYRVESARAALFQFIRNCVDQNVRYALVIHGKGWHGQKDENDNIGKPDKKRQSRIKSYTVHWLKNMDSVLAFSSAQARDGGTGALYVLLKKK